MASLTRKFISTSKAAKPAGPYNQAVVIDRTVYVSGLLGLDKDTMKIVSGGATEQFEMIIKHLQAILEAAGSGIDKIVKTTIFLTDLNDSSAITEVYKKVFTHDFPARACMQVTRLPMDALIEFESIVLTGDVKTIPARLDNDNNE